TQLVYLVLFSFFYFINHLPPQSTLFPYTTLFRSRTFPSESAGFRPPRARPRFLHSCRRKTSHRRRSRRQSFFHRATTSDSSPKRSEEHTSELQSLAYLVCRLLLEKKKT